MFPRLTPADRAASSTASDSPIRTGSATPRARIETAAFRVRGSVDSGRTMRFLSEAARSWSFFRNGSDIRSGEFSTGIDNQTRFAKALLAAAGKCSRLR